MSVWRGVPLHKAIIVRHTPRDHDAPLGRRGTGAIPIGQSGKALDYAGRYGEHAGKGDIDREVTGHDRELMADAAEAAPRDVDAADRLDYALREGIYEGKARSGLDGTLWDQHGTVTREEAQERMEAAGGAFVDSFISIGREYTRQLGIETKEDLQRLVRATWSEAVERWGVVRNPEDIRWVAAAHFDANRSIHVHLYTWSARGEIEPGWTVGREATREGKEIVFKTGYSKIVAERNERSNYLRDLARHAAVRQCGGRVDERAERRLAAKATRLGYPERLSRESDVDPSKARGLEAARARLSSALEAGYGRLAENWRANADARDVVRGLRAASPSFARVWSEYQRCVEVRADLKGLGGSGFAMERDRFVRAEMDELMTRVANGVRNAHLPERDGEGRDKDSSRPSREELEQMRARSRERRAREAERAAEAQARLSAATVLSQHEAARGLGTTIDNVNSMGRDMANLSRAVVYGGYRSYGQAPASVRRMADDWAGRLVSTPRAQALIAKDAGRLCAKDPTRDPREARASVSARVQDAYARRIFDDARDGRFGRPPELERGGDAAFARGMAPILEGMGSIMESLVHAAAAASAGSSRRAGSRHPDLAAERQRFYDDERER